MVFSWPYKNKQTNQNKNKKKSFLIICLSLISDLLNGGLWQLPEELIICNCSSLRSLFSLYNGKQQNKQRDKMQLEAANKKYSQNTLNPSSLPIFTHLPLEESSKIHTQQLWKAPPFTNWPEDPICSTKHP